MKLKKVIICLLIMFCIHAQCFANQDYKIVLNTNSDHEPIEIVGEDTKVIYSESAVLMDQATGKVLYEKNMYDRKYPASTTKILTAIIALEKCDLNEEATASFQAVETVKAGYTNANIKAGEIFTIGQLLDVMMIISANEAASIIAEHISGSVPEFAKLMNEKAVEIGCKNSNFVNANGIHDENHYSTAYDMALIERYCMQNEKYRELLAKKECSLPITEVYTNAIREEVDQKNEKNKNKKKYKPIVFEELSLERNFRNTNSLLKEESIYYYPYCIGGKTGFTTPAKNCLISSSNKDGFETIAVVMHAENTEDGLSARYIDTIKLFEFGYNNYTLDGIKEEYNKVKTKADNDKASIFAGIIDDNNNNNIGSKIRVSKSAIIEILVGISILLLIALYYGYRAIRRKLRSRIYDFKID